MYGSVSESVHYSPKRDDFRLSSGEEYATARGLGLLNFAILNRCHAILGRPSTPILDRLYDSLQRSDASKLAHSATVRDIKVGDFVLAYGDLAEVLEITKSAYAYRSYRVKYLAEKPKPEIQEDWFPARYVQLFHTRARFFADLQREVDKGKVPQDVAERMGHLTEHEIQSILRASLVDVWKLGLRDWVKGRDKTPRKGT